MLTHNQPVAGSSPAGPTIQPHATCKSVQQGVQSADIRESEIFVYKVPSERIYENSCERDLVSCAKERTSSC